ncbi:MAG: DUF1732 domain-containing protein [Zavarzinella sp.]
MTGYGSAAHSGDDLVATVEVRTINNRYLKISVRGTEPYPMLEPEFERQVRTMIKRGTVTISIFVERKQFTSVLDTDLLDHYVRQIQDYCHQRGWADQSPVCLPQLLNMLGVTANSLSKPSEQELGLVRRVLDEALMKMQEMRQTEGLAMQLEIQQLATICLGKVEQLEIYLPTMRQEYQERLHQKVRKLLENAGHSVETEHLIRELALFGERTDIHEEMTRLKSHLQQLSAKVTGAGTAEGKALDFLVQEMNRKRTRSAPKVAICLFQTWW